MLLGRLKIVHEVVENTHDIFSQVCPSQLTFFVSFQWKSCRQNNLDETGIWFQREPRSSRV